MTKTIKDLLLDLGSNEKAVDGYMIKKKVFDDFYVPVTSNGFEQVIYRGREGAEEYLAARIHEYDKYKIVKVTIRAKDEAKLPLAELIEDAGSTIKMETKTAHAGNISLAEIAEDNIDI